LDSYLFGCGIDIQLVENLSEDLIACYTRTIDLASAGLSQYANEEERKSWQLAVKLAREGVIGYFRIVGTRA
jgi:hypothetical protein